MTEYEYLPSGEYVRKVYTTDGRTVITERGTVETDHYGRDVHVVTWQFGAPETFMEA